MSTYKAPADGIFKQNNKADSYGDLWATFGINLSDVYGKLKTSVKLAPTLSEAKTDNDDVVSFSIYKGNIYAFATGQRLMYIESYRNPRISGSWVSSSGAVSPGAETDSVVYNNQLLVSTSTNVAMSTDGTSYDTDWWTTISIGGGVGNALENNFPHIMEVSLLGEETLFVTDKNLVRYVNATSGHKTVTLPAHLVACSITTDAFATWVGTYTDSGDAYVYEIYVGEVLGSTPIARRSYRIKGATAILSMETTEDGVPYLVTDKGKIHTFNGRAFVPVAEFPFANKGVTLAGLGLGDINPINIERAIHPRGMRADGKSLFININTNNQLIVDLAANPLDNDDIFENVVVNERSPSGVWEYNTETKVLNHLAPLSNATTNNGYHRQQTSGPILMTNNQYTRFLTAGRVQSDRTDVYAENPTLTPSGYFITPEIQAETVQEAFEKLVLHKDVLNDETISIKYRTSNRTGIPKYAPVNWTSATSFVVPSDISATIEKGDLVEVIDGYGAGTMGHITEIQSSLTTTTITLDAAIGSNGEAGSIRVANFKQFNTTDFSSYNSGGSDEVGTWIQFMVVLNGNVTIRKIFNKGNAKNTLG